MKQTIRRILDWDPRRKVIYECRRCGTNVGQGSELCPTCDSTNIARYDI